MLHIKTGHLKGDPFFQDICDFISSQGAYGAAAIEYFADQGGCFAIALDDTKIVGTSLNFKADNSKYLKEHLADYLQQEGIELSKCVSPACIYVDAAYSGQGIGDKMSVAKSQHSLEDGYEYTVLWGYESQAIFDYSTRIGNLIDTGVDDQKGFRIYLRRLTDVISSLS